MITAISLFGEYEAPSYHDLRTNLLVESKKELQLLVDTYRVSWEESGCTIMGDGWKDQRKRCLINFLVYSPIGITFIKSVDATDIVSTAANLCDLFSEVVEYVGPKNVVQMVTDNAANYKAAGSLLNDKYPHIFWTPCAAHCINLILKDIADIPYIGDLAKRAAYITIFVYNHKWTLSWLRRRKCWTEILRPGETRFATTFIALKSLHEHQRDLQALVVSADFVSWSGSKSVKARRAEGIVLNSQFWNDVQVVSNLATPLVRLLRLMDTDEKPTLGYVYDGMLRAVRAMKEAFQQDEKMYLPFTRIMNRRWRDQLCRNIHAAAYYVNPVFHYGHERFRPPSEVYEGFCAILDNQYIVEDNRNIANEVSRFKDRLGTYGTELAITNSQTTRPGNTCFIFALLDVSFIRCLMFLFFMLSTCFFSLYIHYFLCLLVREMVGNVWA